MFLLRRLSGKSYEVTSTCQGSKSISTETRDEGPQLVVDQASEHVREGNYEKALWMLESLGQLDPAVKGVAELVAVAEVSYAAVPRSCICLSKQIRNPDWYKILKIDEKSELKAIKRRYRHLALLLHPDKNKHVKAEAAFKLVSEAYACLSDKKKRAKFDVKRSLTMCRRCSPKDCVLSESDRRSNCQVDEGKKQGLQRAGSSPDLTQNDWILDQERLKTFRARARARVFGNLAKAWKEKGFLGAEGAIAGKERFCEVIFKQAMMESDQHQRKGNANEADKKRKESPIMTSKDEMVKGPHRQPLRPQKNLGILIRDLHTELVLSIENKECRVEDVLEQRPPQENAVETSTGVSGIYSQEDVEAQNSVLSNRADQNFAQQSAGLLRAHEQSYGKNAVAKAPYRAGNSSSESSTRVHLYLDDVSGISMSTAKNVALSAPNIMSKSCSSKEYPFSDRRCEHFEIVEKSESDFVIKCEARQKKEERDFSSLERQGDEYAGTIAKKSNLCRSSDRGDSLEMEEMILQIQKEKSEQLLKSLQRLREETKTVAASLDHFYTGGSY